MRIHNTAHGDSCNYRGTLERPGPLAACCNCSMQHRRLWVKVFCAVVSCQTLLRESQGSSEDPDVCNRPSDCIKTDIVREAYFDVWKFPAGLRFRGESVSQKMQRADEKSSWILAGSVLIKMLWSQSCTTCVRSCCKVPFYKDETVDDTDVSAATVFQ